MPINPRATTSSGPQLPVKVEQGVSGIPIAVKLHRGWERIDSAFKQKEVKEELAGEERVVKTYYEVTIGEGARLNIFLNHVTGAWYRLLSPEES